MYMYWPSTEDDPQLDEHVERAAAEHQHELPAGIKHAVCKVEKANLPEHLTIEQFVEGVTAEVGMKDWGTAPACAVCLTDNEMVVAAAGDPNLPVPPMIQGTLQATQQIMTGDRSKVIPKWIAVYGEFEAPANLDSIEDLNTVDDLMPKKYRSYIVVTETARYRFICEEGGEFRKMTAEEMLNPLCEGDVHWDAMNRLQVMIYELHVGQQLYRRRDT
jgi:hypothetical protein